MEPKVLYALEWIAGARPPVHPFPMRGRNKFKTLGEAVKFFDNQAEDAELVSLIKETTTYIDFSDKIKRKTNGISDKV